MSDGCTNITLTKQWGTHRKGAVVRVDPLRAKRLIDDGFGDLAGAVKITKRGK